MKQEYTSPIIEIVELDTEDVITASFGGEQAGDNTKGWNTLA